MALPFAGSAALFAAFMGVRSGKQEPVRTALRPERSEGRRAEDILFRAAKRPSGRGGE